MLRASWILFTTHLKRTLLSRRALLCVLVCLVPVAAALLVSALAEQEGEPPALVILWVLQMQMVVPLVSLLLGSAVVAEEIEDRTVTYLFTRPIPRASLLVGRWFATLAVLWALLAASAWFVIRLLADAAAGDPGLAVSESTQVRLMQTILLGGATYSLVFAAAGAFLKHPIIVGLGYTFAFEGLLANIPGSGQRMTILYYLKSFLAGGDESVRSAMYEFASTDLVSPSAGLTRLIVVMVVAAGLGAWTVTKKQYVLPS